MELADPFIFQFSVFVMAIFVGYYVVWSVTPALHTPLMSVTNAISSVIIVGALLATGPTDMSIAKILGFIAMVLAAINIFGGFQDIGPVIVEQLKRGGFDASFRMLSDVYDQMSQGEARAFLNGHGGSVRDPYFTLRLYHSRFVKPTGTPAEHFWRWSNPEFDAIVDQMGKTDPSDPELQKLFHQAMEIWLHDLPSVPLVQWYHRIPHNETYWKNWPTAQNPYINSAYWHRTFLLVLLGLEPAQI